MNVIQEYNGWTNRETWATKLHLDNDQALQSIALDYTRTALQDEQVDGVTAYALGEQLESWIAEDLFTLENLAGNEGLFSMLTDIGSLYRVNWREIAESFISDVVESQKVSA
jgi:hypothetical protein